jgi:integrase
LSQLRGDDVQQVEGIWAVRITPEAGTVKTEEARIVPLHSHLIEQGFPAFAKAQADGPLFYDPSRKRVESDDNRYYKKVGEHLASWVKGMGITGVMPNHGWRHTFKTLAFEVGIEERVADAIQGHAPTTVSRTYGRTSLRTMANAIEKFPRFDIPGVPLPGKDPEEAGTD